MYLVSGTLMEPTSIFSDVLRTIEARMRHLKTATEGRSYGTGHRTLYCTCTMPCHGEGVHRKAMDPLCWLRALKK